MGPHVHVAGTAPIMPGEADPPVDAYAQTKRCLEIVLEALAELGAGPEHVVRTRAYLTDADDWKEVGRAHGEVDIADFGTFSDNDDAYSLRGGYWFNPHFAVEGFYSNVFDRTYTNGCGCESVSLEATAVGLGIVGKQNFGADGNGFFIDGRAGISRGKLEGSATGLGSDSETSTKPYYGVGVGYDFTNTFGVSLNYDVLKGSGEGVDVTAKPLTLGIEYRWH